MSSSSVPARVGPDASYALPTKTVRFDGSCCVNLRSVTSAIDVMEGSATTPITLADLTSFLWFIEMCVTSRALYFDGTVPPGDIAKAMTQIERLNREAAMSNLPIEAIRFHDNAAILDNACSAVVESSLIIDDLALAKIDRPLEADEHEKFIGELHGATALTDAEREEHALELIGQQFRGSKCVAALIAAGPEKLRAALRAYETHPDAAPRVSAALINRFRLNYLNQLASWRAGIYTPDPGLEPLTEQHARLFRDHLLKRVSEEIRTGPDDTNILAENMRQAAPLPPIGLYALMLTKDKGKPIAVLETALERFKNDSALQKLMWERTEEGLKLKDGKSDLEAYARGVEEHFENSYSLLDRQAKNITSVAHSANAGMRKWVIPALLTTSAAFVPPVGAGAAAIAFKLLIGTSVTAGIRFLSDRLAAGGCNSYLSQYRSLSYDFERARELKTPLSEIASRVEEIFGRPLA